MPITVTQGAVNTTNLQVPGLSVGIIPPQPITLNGTPTNIAGFVGTASYGPVDTAVQVQGYAGYSGVMGPVINRANDLGTAVSIAGQQGCTNAYVVRVTDGTDTAASAKFGVVSANDALMLTAKYTGSAGNAFTATIQASQYPNAVRVLLYNGMAQPELFDNIPNSTPLAFWTALALAINNGNTAQRPASQYFTATLGTLTTTAIPSAGTTLALTGGTDGVAAITSSILVGVDGNANTRTGMYALRGTGASWGGLVDCSDDTTWPTQLAFGLSALILMVTCGPSGSTLASAVSTAANGAAGYGLKIMFGDWLSWLDTVNNIVRVVSPIAFVVGRGANLPPNYSTLNQQVYGIVGSQFAASGLIYTYDDLLELVEAGYDVITPPGQGPGNLPIWCCATGLNSNFNPAANGDNYSTMTNFLAGTIAAVGGLAQFLGQPITPQLMATEVGVLDAYMQSLQDNPGNPLIQGFQNTITNPAPGVTAISSQVTYLQINREIVVNLQGGQTVLIQVQSSAPGQ